MKELSYKFLMSIPHLAFLWDMRRHQRYQPLEGLNLEIKSKDDQIHGLLLDICMGGMRVISTDKRIGDAKTISLSVDDFRVDLPCQKIWKIEYYYGIKFGDIDKQAFIQLKYFIEHFTKEPPRSGPTEVLN